MDRQLREIDDEINLTYEMCLKAGYTHNEIMEYAKPLLQPIVRDRKNRQMWQMVKSLSKVFMVLGFGLLLLFYVANYDDLVTEKVHLGFRLVSRAALMQVLSFWDWTPLYEAPCLVSNPYFGGSGIIKADCVECESLKQIIHTKELAPERFTSKYLMRFRPVIVEDATGSWQLMNESFNIDHLLDFYLEDANLQDICKFNSSLGNEKPKEILEKIKEGAVTQFSVQWVNCNKGAVRYVRKFYNRPYFSSEAVEFTGNSWVVLSSQFKSPGYVQEKLENNDMVLFLVQARGYSNIRLTPKRPCNKICSPVTDVLNEAEILMVPAKMWSLEYGLPSDTDNFLLGLEAYA